jgi:hypothetical protein
MIGVSLFASRASFKVLSKRTRKKKMSTQNFDELRLDRDLTWLEFNRRVLAEALDERTPAPAPDLSFAHPGKKLSVADAFSEREQT